MMNHDSKRPVTLEDILRLKRAERPPAEFWNQFDRELRAKQLAALVEKRPWWRTISLSKVFAGFRRYHLPLGATAVLAVTILSVREYNTAPVSAPVSSPVAARVVQPEGVTVAPVASTAMSAMAVNPTTVVRLETTVASGVVAAAEPAASASREFVLSSAATPTGSLAEMIPVVGAAASADDSAVNLSPSARLIAENFAALQISETALSSQLLSPARGFETRALPARTKPVEPLAQMRIPSGSRRSNLIASATLASTTTPVLPKERSARSLSDERLYETVSRVNAFGAGMLVKF